MHTCHLLIELQYLFNSELPSLDELWYQLLYGQNFVTVYIINFEKKNIAGRQAVLRSL